MQLIRNITLIAFFIVVSIYYLNISCIYTQPDLAQYWAGSKLYSQGGNPYSLDQMTEIQSSLRQKEGIIRLWNPPLIFPIIFYFKYFDFQTLKTVWFPISVTLLFLSIAISYSLAEKNYESAKSKILLLALLMLMPAIPETLAWGQISSILLFGVTLWFYNYNKYGLDSYLSGIFLSLTFIKPHLLIPLYLIIFCHSFAYKQFKCVVGLVSGFFVLFSLSLINGFEIWKYYFHSMSSPPIYWMTPNLGTILQWSFNIHEAWLRFLPLILYMVILIFCELSLVVKKKKRSADMFFIILWSLISSPYGWVYDQIVLIPFLITQRLNDKELKVVILISILSMILTKFNPSQLNGLIYLFALTLIKSKRILYCD